MSHEDPGNIAYNEIGGLTDQIRELREVIELPLRNPELFIRVGINVRVIHGFMLYSNQLSVDFK